MAINQLKAGAFLSYVSIGLNMVVGLLYTPYMLRMLGQSEYGLYSLASSIIAYLTVLDLGFGNAIVRYTAKFRSEGKEREQQEMFGMFFLLYIGIGLVAVIAGSLLAPKCGTDILRKYDCLGGISDSYHVVVDDVQFGFYISNEHLG